MTFNLENYLKRIHYTGAKASSFEVLDHITRAHAQSIPFENIDVVLNRPIGLTSEAISTKLVDKQRGGYCFEQNGLLLMALEALGFDVKPISGRVRLRFTERSQMAPRTHVFLKVVIGQETFFTDVGMGSASLTGVLKFVRDLEQDTPHDTRRLVHESGLWFHQIRYGDLWQDACEFTLEEMPLIDREIANWYTSAHPQSHFRDRLVAARALDNHQRISLENFDFTIRTKNGEAVKRKLESFEELFDVLTNRFGLLLTDEDCQRLAAIEFLTQLRSS